MNIHNLTADEALRNLVSSRAGLLEKEAIRRLTEYGPNEIREARGKPLYLRFIAQFTHFLAVLLWIAAALCFVLEYLRPGEGMLPLGVAIVAVIAVNAVFTFVQEYRAEKAVEALKKLLPYNVKVRREGVRKEVPSAEVAPGEIIILGEGDKIPADARLIKSDGLMVNNAPLTGESDAKARTAEPSEREFMDSPNIVLAGTLVVRGSGEAMVFATGMYTEFGKIAHLTGTVSPGLSPLQREIKRVTRMIAVISGGVGIFFFSLGMAVGMSFWHNFLFAIGIILANVPEGLLPTLTLALAMGSQRMARKKALIKTLTAVETLGSVTVICTDKTGTLTENSMELKRVWSADSITPNKGRRMLMVTAALANDAVYEGGRFLGDPTEVALLRAGLREAPVRGGRLYEAPFDADRKRMTAVCEFEGTVSAFMKGAPETVTAVCSRASVAGAMVPFDAGLRAEAEEASRRMMDEGLRVISFAYRELGQDWQKEGVSEELLEKEMVFLGLAGLEDPLRKGVPEAVAKCRDAGIRVIMITGDAARTANSIAKQAGIACGGAPIEGLELEAMSDAALRDDLAQGTSIFARMTPRHKMRVVSVLKDEGERVAVTGDGVNDAPALKKADVGIAMGVVGTDVAREAADVVLLDDNFATIVNAVEEGRAIFDNIKKFITYIFAHLTPEAVPYVMFALFKIPLPLTVMQILAIDLGTETLPALALGVERPESGIMKRPPRHGSGLIDKGLLFRGYIFMGIISAAGVLTAYFFVLYSGGWRWGEMLPAGSMIARQAATATFLGIVIMQVGTVFACRSSVESVFQIGLFSNRLVMAGIALELILAAFIVYHPVGNRIFGSGPVGIDVWLLMVPFSAALFAAEEMRKYFVRKEDGPSNLEGFASQKATGIKGPQT
jgi:sodium/potassium-transporting ATPase subunit alpha